MLNQVDAMLILTGVLIFVFLIVVIVIVIWLISRLKIAIRKFNVNEYLSLKLKGNETIIYVKGKRFNQCKFLLLEIPVDEITSLNDIESIDEAAERLDKSLEPLDGKKLERIPPETEFWGHCSNLQVWAENNYNTRLLHRNMAFPLLKKLTEVGDPIAKKIFKDEIAKRIERAYPPIVEYLSSGGYLDYFNEEEIESLFGECEFVEHNGKKIYVINGVLNLRWKKLTTLPDSIGNLTSLKELDLGGNELSILPESIGNLSSLKELDLRWNQLSTLPESITKLTSLQTLYLRSNQLSTLPESITKLTSLETLWLEDNKLSTLPESITKLKSLKKLYLGYNQLSTLPESISSLKLLQELYLGGNELTTLPESISNLKSLTYLDLDNNQLSTLPGVTRSCIIECRT